MRRFYTLIELLTVIFIIVVLAGLIMPATSLVRGKARRTSCASNLKQVSNLAMQFSNDRDGQLLPYNYYYNRTTYGRNPYVILNRTIDNATKRNGRFGRYVRSNDESRNNDIDVVNNLFTTGITGNQVWTTGLIRLAKYNMNIFFCPSDERDLRNIFTAGERSSYSLNYGSDTRPGGRSENTNSNLIRMSQVRRSPGTVLQFLETAAGRLGVDSQSHDSDFVNEFYSNANPRHTPHSRDYNVSYLDGRVESQRQNDIARSISNGYHRTE